MRASKVFVAGGQPGITYAVRGEDAGRLEGRIVEYLDAARSILVITGPSKSGKTVLVRHALPPRYSAVYVPGARMQTVGDVWSRVASELRVWTEERKSLGRSDSESSAKTRSGSVKPFPLEVEVEWAGTDMVADTSSHERARSRALPEAAAEALMESELSLVVDDFHHLRPEVQRALVGALKDLVYDGLPLS